MRREGADEYRRGESGQCLERGNAGASQPKRKQDQQRRAGHRDSGHGLRKCGNDPRHGRRDTIGAAGERRSVQEGGE